MYHGIASLQASIKSLAIGLGTLQASHQRLEQRISQQAPPAMLQDAHAHADASDRLTDVAQRILEQVEFHLADAKAAAASATQASAEAKAASTDAKAAAMDAKAASADSRSASTDAMAASAEARVASTEAKSASTEAKSASTEAKSASAEAKGIAIAVTKNIDQPNMDDLQSPATPPSVDDEASSDTSSVAIADVLQKPSAKKAPSRGGRGKKTTIIVS